MQNTSTNINVPAATFSNSENGQSKEPKLKLSLEARHLGDVIIIHCEGRIVYRAEAAALSRMVGEAFQHSKEVVLDFEGVQTLDSAGLGELVLLHMQAEGQGKALKLAGANARVRELLDLTNLSSVFEIHPRLEDAVAADDEMEEPV
jgi:anti-sigma B factor antagonist